jgi:hypothetical protein
MTEINHHNPNNTRNIPNGKFGLAVAINIAKYTNPDTGIKVLSISIVLI